MKGSVLFASLFLMFFTSASFALVCGNSAATHQDNYNLSAWLSKNEQIRIGDSLKLNVETSWADPYRVSSGNFPITVYVFLDNQPLPAIYIASGNGKAVISITPTLGMHSIRVVSNQVDSCQVTIPYEVKPALTPPTGQVHGKIESVSAQGRVTGWACVNGNKSPQNVQFILGAPGAMGPQWSKTLRADTKSTPAVYNTCNSIGEYFDFEFTFTAAEIASYCNNVFSATTNGVYIANSGYVKVPCGTLTPINKGQIESVSNGVMSGWACINGVSQSVDVDIYAGIPERLGQSNRLATITANGASNNTVSSACNTYGVTHGMRYQFSSAEKSLYCGQALYAVPRNSNLINGVYGDSTPANGSGTFNLPCN